MSNEERENTIALIVGDRRCGKSTLIKKEVIPLYEGKGMSVDIYQRKYNPTYEGVANVFTIGRNGIANVEEMQKRVFNSYNKAIVYEEARSFFGAKLDQNTIDAMIDTGNANVDLYFVYQCWAWVPADIIRVADLFICFNTNDSPEDRSDYLSKFEIAEMMKGIKKLKEYGQHFDFIR